MTDVESGIQETTPQDEVQQEVLEETGVEDSEDDKWETRYKVLQGKFNAEVPRYAEIVRSQKDELEYLKGQLDTLKEYVAKSPSDQPDVGGHVEDEEIKTFFDEYGEIAKPIQKLIDKQVQDRISAYDKQIASRVQNVEQQTHNTRLGDFYGQLNATLPEWEVLNTDPNFLAWLNTKDRFSGLTKMDLLKTAYNNLDASQTLEFFKAYKEEVSDGNSQPPLSADRFIAPPRSGGRPATRPTVDSSGKPIFKREDVQKFYFDSAHGRLNMTPEQKVAREKEILAAMRENRIID